MAIRSFRDLEVYRESLLLAKKVDDMVKGFPKDEKFLLIDQMKRASRAVPSLIAEGWIKRTTIKVFRKYLRDAIGEANEMMNHLEQARLFGYLEDDRADCIIQEYDHVSAKLFNLKTNWTNR